MDTPHPMRNVIVRSLQLPIPNFAVTAETTIAGIPVEALELPPRARHPDGSPRFDLLSFRLRTRSDCPRLKLGQRVLVACIELLT
jgi:hypothetical protein